MAAVRIGPCRLADARGTHEPGEVLDSPTPELVELAKAKTLDPESGKPYVTLLSDAKAAAALAAAADPTPDPEPTPEPTPEPAPETT